MTPEEAQAARAWLDAVRDHILPAVENCDMCGMVWLQKTATGYRYGYIGSKPARNMLENYLVSVNQADDELAKAAQRH
jgi:hypothetical protein